MWGVLAIPTLSPLRVAKTVVGSPADAAGVRAGDLIKTVDGHPVTSFEDLIEILKTKRPWESLRATLERDGSSIDVASLLVPRPLRKAP
jgi:S1-C subfamily serine protease